MNDKQLAFVREFAVDRNATKAAIRAGYSAKTANSKAAHLMRDPRIKKAVEAEAARHAERVDVTVDEIVKALRDMAYLDRTVVIGCSPEDLKELPLEVRQCIESVEFENVVVDGDGDEVPATIATRVKKVKFTSRQGAIDALMRYKGMNREKREHGIDTESLQKALAQIPDKQLSALAEACDKLGIGIN